MTDRLRIQFCDHLSIMRGKYLPASKIGDDESRFAQPTFAVHYDKDLLLEAPGTKCLQGIPDMTLRWKAAEIRQGWEPNTKVVTGDLYLADGTPLPLCARGALKRAVADWERHGLTPKIGIELEAYAFTRNADGSIVPYDAPGGVVYGTGNFSDPRRFTDAIWNKAQEIGLPLDLITSEYDNPQFEFTLSFDDAVAHVDTVVLFRQMAREVALDHGIILTFLPKPFAKKGGSGMHINLSFSDANGKNALANGDRGDPAAMNALAQGSVAGWMRHHQGLAGLIAPNALSYARLQPSSLSGYWCNWRRQPQCDSAPVSRGRQEGAAGTPDGRCGGQSLHGGRGGIAGGAAGVCGRLSVATDGNRRWFHRQRRALWRGCQPDRGAG